MKQNSFVEVIDSWVDGEDFSSCECGLAFATFNPAKAKLSLWWKKGASTEIKVEDLVIMPREGQLIVRVWGMRGQNECRIDLEMQKFYLH